MKPFITLFLILLHSNLFSQVFWDEVNTGVNVQLKSVSNVSGQIAWACGYSGTVIRTTNSGYNWVSNGANGIPPATQLINIYALDANFAVTAGYVGSNTFVYRTTNGGANWFQVFTETNGFINVVWMTTLSNGIMQGDPVGGRWSLWKTSNGGLNWDSAGMFLPQAGSEAGWNNSIWYYNSRYWFGTNNNKIYYSTNSGTNWTSQATLGEVNSYIVAFDTIGNGWLGGDTLLKTTNFGQSWSPNTGLPGTGNIFGAVQYTTPALHTSSWIARGTSVYYSPNLGSNWITQYTASAGTYNHMSKIRSNGSFTGPGFIYAVRSNGGISRANVVVEGVTLISNEIPANFEVKQNYPNPFNPNTKIVFSVGKLNSNNLSDVRGAFVSLKVYDMLGKEVADLHNKIIQPGTYYAEWNASDMPSGMYFYRIVIKDPGSGKVVYTESRKMALVK